MRLKTARFERIRIDEDVVAPSLVLEFVGTPAAVVDLFTINRKFLELGVLQLSPLDWENDEGLPGFDPIEIPADPAADFGPFEFTGPNDVATRDPIAIGLARQFLQELEAGTFSERIVFPT